MSISFTCSLNQVKIQRGGPRYYMVVYNEGKAAPSKDVLLPKTLELVADLSN